MNNKKMLPNLFEFISIPYNSKCQAHRLDEFFFVLNLPTIAISRTRVLQYCTGTIQIFTKKEERSVKTLGFFIFVVNVEDFWRITRAKIPQVSNLFTTIRDSRSIFFRNESDIGNT